MKDSTKEIGEKIALSFFVGMVIVYVGAIVYKIGEIVIQNAITFGKTFAALVLVTILGYVAMKSWEAIEKWR